MRILITLGLLLFTYAAFAQVKTMPSKILGTERTILVHVPRGSTPFPVLYLLDGASNFDRVVSTTEYLSAEGLCPAMIIVGIIHPDRNIDLVPLPGNHFMSYLENEVIPFIDSSYSTSTYKLLIGHSLGGLTVINTLVNQPRLFNAYVSLEAALWWDNQKLVKEAKQVLPTANYKDKTLFLAIANRMEKGVDTAAVQRDTSGNTDLIRSNLDFIKDLSSNKQNGLRFQHKYYENDNHNSVRLIGEYDALRFVFDFYRLTIYNSQFDNPDFKLDSLVIKHYQNISRQMGYSVKPDESQVNNLGYRMLNQKQLRRAEALFALNIVNYPSSANAHDSVGDLYLAKGDTANAIISFRKSLSLAEVQGTKEKLNKLLQP